jgi:hypothetical protein
MKKIATIVFLAGIVLITSSVYAVSYLNYTTVKKDNDVLREKIKKVDFQNKVEENTTVTLNDNIKKLEEELKEEINIYNLWLKTKDKITSALSS